MGGTDEFHVREVLGNDMLSAYKTAVTNMILKSISFFADSSLPLLGREVKNNLTRNLNHCLDKEHILEN